MSFSSEVKAELSRIDGLDRHCRIAELSSIIHFCGMINKKEQGYSITLQTENKAVFDRFIYYITKDFNYSLQNGYNNIMEHSGHVYSLTVEDQTVSKILMSSGIMDANGEIRNSISNLVIKSDCCRRAYIRCAFLCAGSVSTPEKYYHLEFVCFHRSHAMDLSQLINYFGLSSKIVPRKGHFVVYLKEGEQVVDILNIMGAHISLLEMENMRVTKDIRNNVNRKVNCETANINKTVAAAVKQLEDIELIEQTKGLSYLPPHLEEIARIRLSGEISSLKDLGGSLSRPISKSGVNHRLRKISEIADNIRNGVL